MEQRPTYRASVALDITLGNFMDAAQFIEQAISQGETVGLDALDLKAKFVFAISEAEVTCDIDGIDNLVYRYGKASIALFAQAFAAIGASEISIALGEVALADDPIPEHLLSAVNRLITERNGYTYESIEAFVRKVA